MKHFFTLIVSFCVLISAAQQHVCSKIKQNSSAVQFNVLAKSSSSSVQITHEMKYDVKFVHLNLNVERNTKYISGYVKTVATVTSAVLDTFMTLLHQNHTVDSIRFNGALLTYFRQDSMIKAGIPSPLPGGATFTAMVYYKGMPPAGGSAIGSGFSTQASWYGGNNATWSLSESFVAYHWWPCKQALTDKIDSSWVFITTDSTNKAGSNGVLKNVVNLGIKKRYEWKSHKPIDYYLISVAVSRFKEYNLYAKPQYLGGDSILIQNYIDASAYVDPFWIANDKVELDKMPSVLNFLSNMYGMYPFYKEKYGHCMVPLGGGMEHNTMTTIGFFDYYIDAHELGHQWWGDQVTCKTWGDIWINEGFASYTEHLVAEYLDPANFAANLNAAHQNVIAGAGGSIYFTGNDTLNSNRIFDSRLTYDKGGAIIHSLRFLTNNDSVWFNTLRGFQTAYKHSTASALDFQNYYQAQTGINPGIFFNQWYYGEGYPIFTPKYNYTGDTCIIKVVQTVSMPSKTPLFITPIEYKIGRTGKPDTTIRVMHSIPTEIYKFPLKGAVTSLTCDPNNWIINKATNSVRDQTLGVNILGIAVDQKNEPIITISPNPSHDFVTITCSGSSKALASVYDLAGKLMFKKELLSETQLDLRSLAAGVYLVKVVDENGIEMESQKLICQ
ncbi:MAG: M1 family aminopeptidase [bacterium]|nr:M1 family aminopeptidase [bacterium]